MFCLWFLALIYEFLSDYKANDFCIRDYFQQTISYVGIENGES